MLVAANSTPPSHARVNIGFVFAEIPNGAGDVWSVLIAVVAFALLFAVVRFLDRV